jgi:hypothetical protein
MTISPNIGPQMSIQHIKCVPLIYLESSLGLYNLNNDIYFGLEVSAVDRERWNKCFKNFLRKSQKGDLYSPFYNSKK